MADSKLSALAALAASDVAPATDLMYIDDISVTTSKKITVADARGVLATEQASTSGTEIDFTGIPAGVKRITVMFKGVSSNGTSDYIIQLGDAGGFEATGYLGAGSSLGAVVASLNYTTGFCACRGIDGNSVVHGSINLHLENSAAFSWVASGVVALSDFAGTRLSAGSKSLTAELTQVRITTVNGTDAFDAGAINISYE